MDIENNPFPKSAPKFVRMKLYKYHFTGSTNQIIPKNGVDWWSREFVSEYLPPLSLDREADIKQILGQMGIDTSPKNYNDNILRKTKCQTRIITMDSKTMKFGLPGMCRQALGFPWKKTRWRNDCRPTG